jgi:hypothetical protein
MIGKIIPTCITLMALMVVPAASAFQAEDTAKATTKKARKAKQTDDAATKSETTGTKAATKTTPVRIVPESDIAAAKASGKVWVNTDSGVYHKGGEWYGATKQGKFMTEQDAIKAGYRASKAK